MFETVVTIAAIAVAAATVVSCFAPLVAARQMVKLLESDTEMTLQEAGDLVAERWHTAAMRRATRWFG